MAEIVLCCGRVCSGKSTFSKKLELERNFFWISTDDWMLKLYEPTEDRTVFDRNLQNCEELIYRTSEKLLAREINVVLDSGFWRKSERDLAVARFDALGHKATIVYFPIDKTQQLEFMRKRQAEGNGLHYDFNESAISDLNAFFEEPILETTMSSNEYLGLSILTSPGHREGHETSEA